MAGCAPEVIQEEEGAAVGEVGLKFHVRLHRWSQSTKAHLTVQAVAAAAVQSGIMIATCCSGTR